MLKNAHRSLAPVLGLTLLIIAQTPSTSFAQEQNGVAPMDQLQHLVGEWRVITESWSRKDGKWGAPGETTSRIQPILDGKVLEEVGALYFGGDAAPFRFKIRPQKLKRRPGSSGHRAAQPSNPSLSFSLENQCLRCIL